jgi:hypothetical protein
MVSVGPPSSFKTSRWGFLTLIWMALRAVGARPPEPPVPNMSFELPVERLPNASLAAPIPDVLRATIVLYRTVDPPAASRPPPVPFPVARLSAMVALTAVRVPVVS